MLALRDLSFSSTTIALAAFVASACGDDGGSQSNADGSGTTSPAPTTDPSTDPVATSTDSGDPQETTSATESSTTATVDESSGGTVPSTSKSLMIAVDGLRPDALAVAETPVFDSLVDGTWQEGYEGAYTDQAQALTDAATVSGPNHWAIMTGATGAQHGVTGNGDVALGDAKNFPHYLSLIERDNNERNTAYLFTWGTDIEVPCEADYIFDGGDDDNVGRVVDMLAQTHDDAAGVLDTQWAVGTNPDAIFLFLDDVDGAGHASGYGPRSEQYLLAVEEIDAQLGQLVDALAARSSFSEESWQIVITSDHGGIGTGHGGMTPEELTIPFLVVGLDVTGGALPPGTEDGGTRIFDTVPTALQHMAVDVPEALVGQSRG